MLPAPERAWRSRLAGAFAALVGAGAVALLGSRFLAGMRFPGFGDEAAHLVGARVLHAGGLLYRDFVDSHGPLIFLLLQGFGRLAGWHHPYDARAITVGLGALAALAVCSVPALKSPGARLHALALFAGLLAAVWLRQGLFMISLYPMAGAFATIVLAAAFGAWRGVRVPDWLTVGAGIALALLCTTAYSFAPTALLLAISFGIASWRENGPRPVLLLLAGAGAGGIAVLGWMLRFADLRGYLAYHFAESQFDYARYIGFSLRKFLNSLWPAFAPDRRIQALAVIATAAALIILLARDFLAPRGRVRHAPEILLGFAGILLLNARGMAIFQDGGFVLAACAALALALAEALPPVPVSSMAALLLIVGAQPAVWHALVTPFGLPEKVVRRFPSAANPAAANSAWSSRLRQLVHPGERMLALVYEPQIYLDAHRLPIRGFYAWFPWDSDYARAPWFGRTRDLCTTLAASPPPVITYDRATVWGFDPHAYMPCLLDILRRDYVLEGPADAQPGAIYVRRDRASTK